MKTVEDFTQLGGRIQQIRLAMGQSQDDLATAIDVDRTTLSRIESGQRKASAVDLLRIAAALDVTFADLITLPDPEVRAARAPLDDEAVADERANSRAELELDAAWRDLQQLRDAHLIEPVTLNFGNHGLSSEREAKDLARSVRSHLSLGDDPIDSISEVAASLGLWCRTTKQPIVGLSMTPSPGLGVGLIGEAVDSGRRRATVAHEIGHHLSGDTYEAPDHYLADREAEALIDSFAAELLLPETVTRRLRRPTREEVIEIAFRYRVSWKLAIRSLAATDADVSQIDRNNTPTRHDFYSAVGKAPAEDMIYPGLPPQWVRACAQALDKGIVTPRRATELSLGLVEEPQP